MKNLDFRGLVAITSNISNTVRFREPILKTADGNYTLSGRVYGGERYDFCVTMNPFDFEILQEFYPLQNPIQTMTKEGN